MSPRTISNLFSLVFSFTATLLEVLPIIGLVFTVSNRVGAAMWAYGMLRCSPLTV